MALEDTVTRERYCRIRASDLISYNLLILLNINHKNAIDVFVICVVQTTAH